MRTDAAISLSLATALDTLRQRGLGLRRGSEAPMPEQARPSVPTGHRSLDAALGTAGWPRGALALIDAPAGSGATTLALGTLAASLLVALLLRDPPAVGSATARPSLGAVYRSAAVWRLGIVFGLYAVAYIVYGTFFAAHLAQRGVDGVTAGRLWSLVGVASIGSGLLGGVLADRLGSSLALAAMFAMEGTGLALLALGDGLAWYAVSAIFFGASFWGFPSAISKACAEIVGPALAPAAIGLLAVFFGVGQVVGPVVGGLLADWTGALSAALLLGAAADLAGVVGSLLLPQRMVDGKQ